MGEPVLCVGMNMMLFFHKLLPIIVLPTGLVCALLLLAVFLEKQRRRLIVTALVLLYVASMPVVSEALIGRLEDRYPAQTIAGCAPADAVIVLGGVLGPNHAGMDFPSWSDGVNRFMVGVALIRAGKAEAIVFSRACIPWEKPRVTEGELLRVQAIAMGVPAEKIVLTPLVADTADEARAAAALCREHGWKHVQLVTTGWHMPRAAWLFKHAGVDFTPFPVGFQRDLRRPRTLLDFLPSAGALSTTEIALRESYGLAYYRVFGPK
ncbi:MAG TPA: YdcF family protein [Opitutaceae bacterium]|nr:YdcF family protein [Opitutaceae bacterium]